MNLQKFNSTMIYGTANRLCLQQSRLWGWCLLHLFIYLIKLRSIRSCNIDEFVFPSMDARPYGRSLHDCTGLDLRWQPRCNVSWMHLECLGAASQIHIIFLNRFSRNTVSFAALFQGSQIRGNGICNLFEY
jgi:hypothetical protein